MLWSINCSSAACSIFAQLKHAMVHQLQGHMQHICSIGPSTSFTLYSLSTLRTCLSTSRNTYRDILAKHCRTIQTRTPIIHSIEACYGPSTAGPHAAYLLNWSINIVYSLFTFNSYNLSLDEQEHIS